MTDNIHLFVRPPRKLAASTRLRTPPENVLAYGRTFDDAAVKWRQIDTQKVLIEKLTRQGGGCRDQRLRLI